MRAGTFNLYNFAEPDKSWYRKSNSYSGSGWTRKKAWISQQLMRLDADVVGFQEVFAVEELKQLVEQAGYSHFVTAEQPGLSDVDPTIYVRPVVALASRFPITHFERIGVDAELVAFFRDAGLLPVAETFAFSRAPLRAVVGTPDFGEITVYVAHLKSKRPIMDDVEYGDEDVDVAAWRLRAADTMRRISRGQIAALLQRGAEAAALYARLADEMTADGDRGVLVMGDLNDNERSVVLDSLRMVVHVSEIGEHKRSTWPQGVDASLYDFRFQDAYDLAPNPGGATRPETYRFQGEPGVIDYILVSNAFVERNPDHIGRVARHVVFNDHISHLVGRWDRADKEASDHGQVVVDLSATR